MSIDAIRGGGAHPIQPQGEVEPTKGKGASAASISQVLVWLHEIEISQSNTVVQKAEKEIQAAMASGSPLAEAYPHLAEITSTVIGQTPDTNTPNPTLQMAANCFSSMWQVAPGIPAGPQRDGVILANMMTSLKLLVGTPNATANVVNAWGKGISQIVFGISNDPLNWSGTGKNPYQPLLTQVKEIEQWPDMTGIMYGEDTGVPSKAWLFQYEFLVDSMFGGHGF